MKAIRLESDGLHFHGDLEAAVPREGEQLVRVLKAGICETDLQLFQGYMGFKGIPGHEFVGIAETGPMAGQRVVGEINCSCYRCDTCHAGRASHCPVRTVVGILGHDGAFAERVAIPQRNLHVVDDSISDDQAVLVEPLAAAFQILDQVTVHAQDRVAVIGDGRLGYLSAQVLAGVSSRVIAIGKHEKKLARFAARGLQTRLLSEVTEADSDFDLVVDCTGSTSGLETAISLVRPRGTLVLKTTVADPHTVNLAAIVIHEINMVGSRCGPFDKALRALEKREVDVDGLITDRFALEDCRAAFDRATSPEAFKVVFDIAAE